MAAGRADASGRPGAAVREARAVVDGPASAGRRGRGSLKGVPSLVPPASRRSAGNRRVGDRRADARRHQCLPFARGHAVGVPEAIAQPAATGPSNRETGQRLYLARRTVGAHLYRICPKLGITSRGQLREKLRLGG
ncbi:LuxR C-terminal-related transcriptional regulator [Streptomyces mirabilis]|uniref:LuxR C-terminal-related transcriptional regulator n=1 Tax=Streptomyces mirabilis TaxID=68239 RepID=UPI003F4BB43D